MNVITNQRNANTRLPGLMWWSYVNHIFYPNMWIETIQNTKSMKTSSMKSFTSKTRSLHKLSIWVWINISVLLYIDPIMDGNTLKIETKRNQWNVKQTMNIAKSLNDEIIPTSSFLHSSNSCWSPSSDISSLKVR